MDRFARGWSVADRPVALAAISVYRKIVVAGRLHATGAAGALHETVQALRRRYPEYPSVWAAFFHVGR